MHGIRSTVLRLTNTIGPRMRIKDARQTFVGIWVKQALRGEPLEIGDFYAGDALIARRLGWRPRTTIRTALTRTIEYYRGELPHYR